MLRLTATAAIAGWGAARTFLSSRIVSALAPGAFPFLLIFDLGLLPDAIQCKRWLFLIDILYDMVFAPTNRSALVHTVMH